MESAFVGVADYGVGTWVSVLNMLTSVGIRSDSCQDPKELYKFSHIVLPGVGNFSAAAAQLEQFGWTEELLNQISSGTPTLGICLGMQLLGKESQESPANGLGVMEFTSEKLSDAGGFRVPHMGWNSVEKQSDHVIFSGWSTDFRFYFAHSYAVPQSCSNSVGLSLHNQPFSSVVAHENVVGVQFHPEKSHRFGKKIFENFVEMD
jgi:glutamine amidotransferase